LGVVLSGIRSIATLSALETPFCIGTLAQIIIWEHPRWGDQILVGLKWIWIKVRLRLLMIIWILQGNFWQLWTSQTTETTTITIFFKTQRTSSYSKTSAVIMKMTTILWTWSTPPEFFIFWKYCIKLTRERCFRCLTRMDIFTCIIWKRVLNSFL